MTKLRSSWQFNKEESDYTCSLVLTIGLSYFIYHTLLNLKYPLYQRYITIPHHIATIIELLIILLVEKVRYLGLLGLVIIEMSYPLLLIRITLVDFNLKHTKLYQLVDTLFIITFLFSRVILLIPINVLLVIPHPDITLLTKILITSSSAFTCYMLIGIIK